MVRPLSGSATHGNQALVELFLCDSGFSLSDDASAYRCFSQKLSALLDRPVVVVNLADLSHAYENPFDIPAGAAFTAKQLKKREAELVAICAATLPDQPAEIWRRRNLARDTAANANADLGSLTGRFKPGEKPHGILEPRLQGECWHQAAIILAPDRRWSEKSMWAMRTGLSENVITRYPKGPGQKLLSFFHELAHTLQLSPWYENGDIPPSAKWENETNADIGAIEFGTCVANHPRAPVQLVRSIRTAIAWEAPVRALARFLNAPNYYGTALAIDRHIKGKRALPFERVLEAEDEMRWRAYEMLLVSLGLRQDLLSLQSNSRLVQNTTHAYHEGKLIDTGLAKPIWEACDIPREQEQRLPLLRILEKVLREHPVTDPLARHAARLALAAFRYSCSPVRTGLEITGTHLPAEDRIKRVRPAFVPPQPAEAALVAA